MAILKGSTRNSDFALSALSAIAVLLSQSVSHAAKAVVIEGEQATLGNPSAPQKGTMNQVFGVEPSTLNPITGTDRYNSVIQGFTVDSLMELNIDTYKWMPAIAERAEQSADGKTFTFQLRKGAVFHDGKPVTVEDVKFSFDVIFDPKYNAAHMRPYYENIEKAEIVGPQTIRFTVKEKYFKNFEVVASLGVLPKHVYGDAASGVKKNKTIIGSGPYKIERYDQGQSLVLAKNKDWWGFKLKQNQGRYNFDRIRIRFIKDENIILETLKKGDLDEYDAITPEAFEKKASGPEWGKTVFKVKAENLAPKGFSYIGWNLRNDLFKDKDVRLALYHLLNREEMIKKFRFNMSLPATGPWYRQSEFADPSVKPVPFDAQKAAALLKKAGWSDSNKDGVLDKKFNGKQVDFRFTLSYGNKDVEKYYVLYQEDLKKAGIEMRLQLLEWNALLKNIDEANFEAISLGWTGSVEPDPKQIWHSASAVKGGSNFIGYKNPEVDKLIDAVRVELDASKRKTQLRKIYALIAQDYPYAFMFNDKYVLYAHSANMKMVKPTYKYGVGEVFWWFAN